MTALLSECKYSLRLSTVTHPIADCNASDQLYIRRDEMRANII